MNPEVPIYITQILFVIVGIIIYFILYSANFALKKTGCTLSRRCIIIIATAVVIGIWLIITSVLGFKGYLLDFQSTPPKLLLVVIPAALAITYTVNSQKVLKLVDVIPGSWLIYIQSFRILMEILLLLLFLKNIIPVQMTFEGRNYDILIGLSAPIIAYYFAIKKFPKVIVLLWNIAGLLLVSNIFLIAVLSAPGPLRKFFVEPPNTIVAYFPYIWIPAFIVPFAYFAHILSIKQFIRSKNAEENEN